jgi:uncharacterized membrane protein
MFKVSIWTGIILVVLGVAGYLLTGATSPTALIPAAFGIIFIILGFIARKDSLRRHAMHGAAVVSLLGIAGTAGGVLSTITLLGGGTVERPEAAVAKAVMAVICIVFLALAIRSFINARRNPAQPQN